MLPIFITGNQNKVDYLSRSLGMDLPHQKIDLDEIQSVKLPLFRTLSSNVSGADLGS